MRFFLVILLTINYIETAKILIYNPAFGHSHTKFLGRIGDVLSQNGHQVTELVPLQNPLDYKKVSKLTKIIELPQDARIKEMMLDSNRDGGMMSQMWTMDPTPQALSQMAQNMSLMMTYTCESILEHKNLWWHLKDEQFDIGISEAFDFAGYGVFHMLGVKSYITASSSIMLDHLAYLIGQPIVPSYVPGAMGDVTEQMTFTQRAMNAFGAYVGSQMFLNIMHKQSAVFQEKLGSDFPSIASLVSDKSASVLINSIPYLNFPHPKLHKVQEIGGIGIPTVKPVSKEWDEILNRKSKTIYISFGSVAKSKLMPVALKKSLIETTRRFPELFTDLKSFIHEEIAEGFRRNELKDHFVILNAKESDRVSVDTVISHKVLSLCNHSPESFNVIGRLGKYRNFPRPILCRMKPGFALPIFKDLAERLKKIPDLAHINIRRAETAKQRHEGYLRRQAARDLQSGDPQCPVAEIKQPSTPIELSRADTLSVIASPQLPATVESIVDTPQLPIAVTPVHVAPIDQKQQAHDDYIARFMVEFDKSWKKEQPALIEGLTKRFGKLD